MMDIISRLGDDAIGFEVGWRMPPIAFGSLGQAALACDTGRDALELFQRYWRLISRGIQIDVSLNGNLYVATFTLLFPLVEPLRHIVFELAIASFYRAVIGLVPHAAEQTEVWLDVPEPSYGSRLRDRIPGLSFGKPIVQIRCPASFMDAPLPMASPAGRLTAIEKCNAEERLLKLEGKVSFLVQKKLGIASAGFPSLNEMANQLNIPVRSLRRQLTEEGTKYSILVNSARHRDAIKLLENPALDVAEIADQLWYTDSANFIRAFRRWTKITPSKYRTDAGIY